MSSAGFHNVTILMILVFLIVSLPFKSSKHGASGGAAWWSAPRGQVQAVDGGGAGLQRHLPRPSGSARCSSRLKVVIQTRLPKGTNEPASFHSEVRIMETRAER